MQYTVLGPVGVRSEDHFHAAGNPKEQGVLAILLMERGRAVSAQTLADRLWDEHPPQQFRTTLQAHISRLRRRLRETGGQQREVIASSQAGYRIDVPADQVDVHHFDLLVSQAQARVSVDPHSARKLLRQAEALWNGEPLAGLAGTWVETIRRILTDKRRTVLLRRIELDLQTGGDADDAVAELTELASGSRVDQRVVELLMIALDTAGRPGDALALFHDTRNRLREKTGTDPRPELRTLYQRLLNGSAHRQTAAPDHRNAPERVDTLDPEPPYVAGREEELAAIVAAVTADLRPGKRSSLFAIDGLAGIGKTTLALQAAHLLRSRCPDGALQVNMHSHDPHLPPLDPQQALTQLLDAIGTPWRELARADTLPALAALWRKGTSGRRLLLLLDDVADAAQIELLVPATAGTIVLITSRRRLTGTPGNHQSTLGPLPDAAARELLAHITDRSLPDDEDLVRFTRSCGGLALAITVAAGHLRSRPVWTVGDLVNRLSTTSQSLVDDPLTGPIHTAFAMSYRTLNSTLQDLLRHIAAHAGPDIGLPTAAAMSGAALADTDIRLDALVDHRLLEHTSAHRYRLHDLLRQYILAQADEEQSVDSRRGVERAVAFYEAAAARAEHALHPRRRELHYPAASAPVAGVNLDTPEQARAWLDAETLNLSAAVTWCVQVGRSRQIRLLPHVLAQHMDRRGRWPQALEIVNELLAAPDAGGSSSSASAPAPAPASASSSASAPAPFFPDGPDTVRACLLTDQAGLFFRASQWDDVLRAGHAALVIWNQAEDHYGQADVHIQIGRAHDAAGRRDEAVRAFRTAAALYESLGDRSRVAVAEDQWAVAAFLQGHEEEGIARGRHAMEIARRQNDLAVICDVLNNLGEMYRRAERNGEALACFQEARTLSDTLGDPLNTAALGYNIAAIYEHAGNHLRALTSLQTALHQFRQLGDHRNEIECHLLLATVHTSLDHHDAAFEELRHATELEKQTRDQLLRLQIHLAEGSTLSATGEARRAIEAYESALELAERADAAPEQTRAHRALFDLYTGLGLHDLAQRHLT